MHTYLNCKFCRAEIPPANSRKAYCDNECKRLYALYGSYENWKGGIKAPKPSGSRKTGRKQGERRQQPEKRSQQPHSEPEGQPGALMVPVKVHNGKEYSQLLLIMDYGEVAPRILTGGAKPYPTAGGNNAKKHR